MTPYTSDSDACLALEAERALEELVLLLTYTALSVEARAFAAWRLHKIRTALYIQRKAVGLAAKAAA